MTAPLLFAEPEPWMVDAACADPSIDPEIFYPPVGDNGHDGRRVCERCIVRTKCLAYALAVDDRFGTWGGLGPNDRDDIRIGKPARNRIDHGTLAGARAHRHRGQPPCPPCSEAERANGPTPCAHPHCPRRFPTYRGAALHYRRVHDGFDPRTQRRTA